MSPKVLSPTSGRSAVLGRNALRMPGDCDQARRAIKHSELDESQGSFASEHFSLRSSWPPRVRSKYWRRGSPNLPNSADMNRSAVSPSWPRFIVGATSESQTQFCECSDPRSQLAPQRRGTSFHRSVELECSPIAGQIEQVPADILQARERRLELG